MVGHTGGLAGSTNAYSWPPEPAGTTTIDDVSEGHTPGTGPEGEAVVEEVEEVVEPRQSKCESWPRGCRCRKSWLSLVSESV